MTEPISKDELAAFDEGCKKTARKLMEYIKREFLADRPISKEELEALHTPEVIAQIQEALEADERGEGRRMTREELETVIKADRPKWWPTDKEIYAVWPPFDNQTDFDAVIRLAYRKLVEYIEEHCFSQYEFGKYGSRSSQWRQLRKEVGLDG